MSKIAIPIILVKKQCMDLLQTAVIDHIQRAGNKATVNNLQKISAYPRKAQCLDQNGDGCWAVCLCFISGSDLTDEV